MTNDPGEPVTGRHDIVVGQREHVALHARERRIQGKAFALPRFVQVHDADRSASRGGLDHRSRVVSRIVVDDHNLDIAVGRKLHVLEHAERFGKARGPVIRADADRG